MGPPRTLDSVRAVLDEFYHILVTIQGAFLDDQKVYGYFKPLGPQRFRCRRAIDKQVRPLCLCVRTCARMCFLSRASCRQVESGCDVGFAGGIVRTSVSHRNLSVWGKEGSIR